MIINPQRQAKKRVRRELRLTGRQYVKLRKAWRRAERQKVAPNGLS